MPSDYKFRTAQFINIKFTVIAKCQVISLQAGDCITLVDSQACYRNDYRIHIMNDSKDYLNTLSTFDSKYR